MEQFVLLWANGLTEHEAWRAIGKENTGPQGNYRRHVVRNRFFKERLEALLAEREALTSKGIWGQLEFQANQNFRLAAAKNDLPGMQKATELLLRVAERTETPPASGAEPKKGPGAPPVETPPAIRNPEQLRQTLLDRGAPAPAPPA